MRHWRELRPLGNLARCLALFAILIQFTVPFGVAVAAGLSDAKPNVGIVFQCLGGTPQTDPDAQPAVPWHSCAMPGGCCVAPTLKSPPITLRPVQANVYRVAWQPVRYGITAVYLTRRPPVRGPPLEV